MKPILFRLDEFLEFMQEAHSTLLTSELSVKKIAYLDTCMVTITTKFRIFDGREFSLTYQKELMLEQVEEDTYSYSYVDKHQHLSAKNCWVFYNYNSQSAYFRNSATSKNMVNFFQDCLPQSILDLISKHPDEERVVFDLYREQYKDESSSRNYISPLYKIKTRTLVQNNSENNKTLYFIKSNAHNIKIPKNCYAYELDLYIQEKEREAAKRLAEEIEKNALAFTSYQEQNVTNTEIKAQETDVMIFQEIDETDSPFFEDTNDEFDPGIFDDAQILDQNGLDNPEPEVKKITSAFPSQKQSMDFDVFELEPLTPNPLPELDIPTLEFHKATTVDIPTSVPEFDLGFIDCQAPHKFDFNLPIPRKVTGWIKRIKEHLQLPRSFYITATNKQDISFKGRLMAESETTEAKLTLYQTMAGQWVAVQQTNGNPDQNSTKVCVSKEQHDILDFFGFSEEAKEIYYQSGIDSSRFIS